MTVLTEREVARAIAKDARLLAKRCDKYVEILTTSNTEEEIIHRIKSENLPGLDEGLIHIMVLSAPSGRPYDYICGVKE